MLLLLLLAGAFRPVQAQQYNFRHYSVDRGLSQSQVTSIDQDQEGYLWIATLGGLNRFDGVDFETFSTDDGLANPVIWGLEAGKDNRIWLATGGGLSCLHRNAFTNYGTEDGLNSEELWAVLEDTQGRLWIGNAGAPINIMTDGKISSFDGSNGVVPVGAFSIAESEDGTIWFGTQEQGLIYYDGQSFNVFNNSFGLAANTVNHVVAGPNGLIWASTPNGVSVYDPKRDRVVEHLFAEINIYNVAFDENDQPWFATYNDGVYRKRMNGAGYDHFTETNGLNSDYHNCIFKDAANNIWIGTNGSGIDKYEGQLFLHFTKKDGLTNNIVMGIAQDLNGNIWMATDRGASRYNGNTIENFGIEDGMAMDELLAVFPDQKGNIWLGSFSGCGVYRPDGSIEWFDAANEFIDSYVYSFAEIDGLLYLCTFDGIYTYDGTSFEPWEHNDAVTRCLMIEVDSAGAWWIGTELGLVKKDGEEFTYYTEEDGLPENEVNAVVQVSNGDHWILTYQGLARLRDGRLKAMNADQGVPAATYYSMLWHQNSLWLGTENGAYRMFLDSDGDIDSVKHFGKEEGFRGLECNSRAIMADREGHIWFGTVRGATRYNPEFDQTNRDLPIIHLRNMRLLYETVDWTQRCENDIAPYSQVPENPCLSYEDNHLTFDFVALEFSNPDKVKYQFMLENFDEDWLPETDINHATYSNLPPGEYRFKVKAANEDGMWSSPYTYDFVIEAPYWYKWWFYLLTIPLVIILIYTFIVMRTRKLARSKRELEELVRLRTDAIEEQKNELQRLSIVASEMSDGVLIFDRTGDLTYCNRGFTRMTGYDLEEFKELTGGNLFEISTFEGINDLRDGKIEGGYINYDFDYLRKDGSTAWANCTITPIEDENGNHQQYVSIYTDITMRKKYETELRTKNKDMMDSIRYAKQIQEAILPDRLVLFKAFPESFIFHKPRDIVSGDFYWFSKIGRVFVLVAADCTGHGVPGAMMSMMGNEYLHQIVNKSSITGPEQALFELDKMIKRALHQEGEDRESKDGMDIAMVAIHLDNLWAQFAGAFNPLYVVRDGEMIEYDSAKEAVGGYSAKEKGFYSHEFNLQRGDNIYMFSDGFNDQFGGPRNKKYMRKRFKEFLKEISTENMSTQQLRLEAEFQSWKGDNKQVDDVLVVGVRV